MSPTCNGLHLEIAGWAVSGNRHLTATGQAVERAPATHLDRTRPGLFLGGSVEQGPCARRFLRSHRRLRDRVERGLVSPLRRSKGNYGDDQYRENTSKQELATRKITPSRPVVAPRE